MPRAQISNSPKKKTAAGPDEVLIEIEGRLVKLSHLSKVLYPEVEFTKKNVLNYYSKVADTILPHLKDRAITLKRYPDGVEGEFFYEKHAPSHKPKWLKTVLKNGVHFVCIDNTPALLWAANLASLEFHPYLSKKKNFAQPSSVVFDLDPGEGTDVLDCAKLALKIRDYLKKLKLESFVKSSGSKGLQLYVPLNTTVSFDETKDFAHAVALHFEEVEPKLYISKMAIKLRKKKVLIDWSQNDAGKTTVCVYSLRGKTKPFVSVPMNWEEVEAALKSKKTENFFFDTQQTLSRIEKFGDIFSPVLTLKQKLPKGKSHG